MYSKEDAISSLKKASNILGETPSMRQYEDLGLSPSRAVIAERWGWQDLKKEAGLKRLEEGDRHNNQIEPKPEGVDIPDDVEWEELSPHMRWYYKNPEVAKNKAKERKRKIGERNRQLIREIKTSRGCYTCGFDEHFAALDFHHRESENKFMTVSKMARKGYGEDKIREEIQKCIVLCANCHRIQHHSE